MVQITTTLLFLALALDVASAFAAPSMPEDPLQSRDLLEARGKKGKKRGGKKRGGKGGGGRGGGKAQAMGAAAAGGADAAAAAGAGGEESG